MKQFILLSMIFLHIIDDYVLQTTLAKLKQKEWWKNNYPNILYKKDYIVALIEHAFSWTFMMMIPINIYTLKYKGIINIWIFILNVIIHAAIDDLKANKGKINLIQDQILHLIQILFTFYFLY